MILINCISIQLKKKVLAVSILPNIPAKALAKSEAIFKPPNKPICQVNTTKGF